MGKKLHFLLFFCLFQSAFNFNLAGNEPLLQRIQCSKFNNCTAPPPDSLRIRKIGTNFISLAWKPAWVGAEHQVRVFKKNELGSWDSLATFNDGILAAHTVENLEAGKQYRFKIATKCSTGEPSQLTAEVDGITLIVELTTQGRLPIKPEPIYCEDIEYRNPIYKWVGFKVTHTIEGNAVSNFFEFERMDNNENDNPIVRIKRVAIENPLVAANQSNRWPTINLPLFQSAPSIHMAQVDAFGSNIYVFGHVFVVIDPLSLTVNLCQDNYPIWDDSYSYEVLVASEALSPIAHRNQVEFDDSFNINEIKVQSPFREILHIFIPENRIAQSVSVIRLIGLNGSVVLEQRQDILTNQISVPTSSIPSGIYILRVEDKANVFNLKVIKSQ